MAKFDQKDEQALVELFECVAKMIQVAIENSPYDRTRAGRIIGPGDTGKLVVEVDGVQYSLPTLVGGLTTNTIVRVCVPENNWSAAFILGKMV